MNKGLFGGPCCLNRVKIVELRKSAQPFDAPGEASAPAHAPHLPPVGEAEKYLITNRVIENCPCEFRGHNTQLPDYLKSP